MSMPRKSRSRIAQTSRSVSAEEKPPETGVPVPGAKAGIERVDVEGEIGRPLPHALPDRSSDAFDAERVRLIGIEHLDAAIARRDGADADLDRALGIDQPLTHRLEHEGAVADRADAVVPGVLVRVELDDGELAMTGDMGAQQRQGDEMVAAEGDELGRRWR
jgi:hypothetical protein